VGGEENTYKKLVEFILIQFSSNVKQAMFAYVNHTQILLLEPTSTKQ